MMLPRFVIITPARNEARFIESTIKSVVQQTILPLKWIIVSDGSTDGTDNIVRKYTARHPWIELIRTAYRRERHFAGKVHAFNAGYARVRDLSYEVIGNLDGDISFGEDYFSFLLQKFAEDDRLGVAGTPFREGTRPGYDYRFVSIDHVSGACQLFRRECFEQIGGYLPLQGGSIDHIAVISARMKGWKTRTFLERICQHHREVGTAQAGALTARFINGAKDYRMGNHPIWEVFRTCYQLTKRPFIAGGLMLAAGYLWCYVRRLERPISRELMLFYRHEQMMRLGCIFTRKKPT